MKPSEFDLHEFRQNGTVKFYFDKGRHTNTSLREYRGELFVHKLLGNRYHGVSTYEYFQLLELAQELHEFLVTKTSVKVAETYYLGYSEQVHCLERVDKYSGHTLSSYFPTVTRAKRYEIATDLLRQIDTLIEANYSYSSEQLMLKYSIDPTPDNFTFDGDHLYFVDFMPPLVRDDRVDALYLSDKLDLENRSSAMFRYFNQKGLYLTFLTKFGSIDVTFAHDLYRLTLEWVANSPVKSFLYNSDFQALESLTARNSEFSALEGNVHELLDGYECKDRDLLRLYAVFFITDFQRISVAAQKYHDPAMVTFLYDKRCTADLIRALIYSDLRMPTNFAQFKNLIISMITLQYSNQ